MEMYSMIQILEEKVKESDKHKQNANSLEHKLDETQRVRENEYEDMTITINRLQ